MRYYPVAIDTQNKKGLLIGGGGSALIKVRALLQSECLLYCLSETFCEELQALSKRHPDRIFLKRQTIDDTFRFFAYDFLILATGDEALEKALMRRANLSSIPVLSTSRTDASDFHLMAQIRRGPLVLSVRSENPTITRYVKKDLETWIHRYDAEKMEQMNAIRRHMVEDRSPYVANVMKQLWEDESIGKDYRTPRDQSEKPKGREEVRNDGKDRDERKQTGSNSGETSV